jgi:hypothetical protein
LARHFNLNEPLLRSITPEGVLMSRLRRIACTDSRPPQLFHRHERSAQVRVPREEVRREVQRKSGRIQHAWRYLGQIYNAIDYNHDDDDDDEQDDEWSYDDKAKKTWPSHPIVFGFWCMGIRREYGGGKKRSREAALTYSW